MPYIVVILPLANGDREDAKKLIRMDSDGEATGGGGGNSGGMELHSSDCVGGETMVMSHHEATQ